MCRRAVLLMSMLLAVMGFAAAGPLAATERAGSAASQDEGVRVVTLENGLTMLLMRRPTMAGQVACGWLLRGGASLDPPEAAGLCHQVMSVLYEPAAQSPGEDGGGEPANASPFAPLDVVQRRLLLLHDLAFWETQYPRWRSGEIGDPFAPENQTPELTAIRESIATAFQPQAPPGDQNAASPAPPVLFHVGATHDFAIAFGQIPSINLADWAQRETARLTDWLTEAQFTAAQSDLLGRRLELGEPSPMLRAQQELDEALWPGHPYGRRANTSISNLNEATYEQASAFYRRHVQPANLVVIVVGDFNPVGATALLRRQFETIPAPQKADPAPAPNTENEQGAAEEAAAAPPPASKPHAIEYEWSMPTRARIAYRTVAIDHPDHAALLLLSRVLRNRLHEELVVAGEGEPPAPASWVAAGADGRARGGVFMVEAESATSPPADGLPGASILTPEQIITRLNRQIDQLKREPVDPQELDAARSKVLADLLSPMNEQMSLLLTLGCYEGLGDWRRFNSLYGEVSRIAAADVQAAARTYLTAQRRVTGRFSARSFDLESDPELARLAEDQRQAALTLLNRFIDTGTPETWAQTIDTLERQLSQAPPLQQDLMRFLIRRLREKLDEVG